MNSGNRDSGETGALAGKRIVLVPGLLVLGGAERQALLLARFLQEQGADVEIWGFSNLGRAAELCNHYAIPWRVIPVSWPHHGRDRWLRRLVSLGRLACMLRRARPDVILPYTILPNVACGWVWRWTGAQTCIWNQRDVGQVGRMGSWSERQAVLRTPWFVANSQHGADHLVETFGVHRDRVRVIHNGIEVAQSRVDRQTWRAQLGMDEKDFIACMVAHLGIWKDHGTLIRAWRKVADEIETTGRQALLLLAGRLGDTYESLQVLTAELGLEGSVRFLGDVHDVSGLLQAVDLCVFSSHTEGCPNGVLEAMAAGLAVAGTDIPGIREAVGPDGYPFLAPPRDAGALADHILELALDADRQRHAGSVNRARIEAEFSPRRMCEDTLALLAEALAR